MGLSEIREQVTTLYNEPEARPELVKSVAEKVGMEKVRRTLISTAILERSLDAKRICVHRCLVRR